MTIINLLNNYVPLYSDNPHPVRPDNSALKKLEYTLFITANDEVKIIEPVVVWTVKSGPTTLLSFAAEGRKGSNGIPYQRDMVAGVNILKWFQFDMFDIAAIPNGIFEFTAALHDRDSLLAVTTEHFRIDTENMYKSSAIEKKMQELEDRVEVLESLRKH